LATDSSNTVCWHIAPLLRRVCLYVYAHAAALGTTKSQRWRNERGCQEISRGFWT